MTDNKEAGWTKIRIAQAVDDLLKYGPSIETSITPIPGSETVKVLAQIDTGAGGTGISPRLAKRLALKPVASGMMHQAGLPVARVPYFKVRLSLPALDIETEVVGLATLEAPHDVLIGRDILTRCRLVVDFVGGATFLHIKHD